MDSHSLWIALFLFAGGLLGAALPMLRTWSPRTLHSLVALSAGVFIGSVLHVVADLALMGEGGHAGHGHGGHSHAGHGHHHSGDLASAFSDQGLWIGFAGGFLLLCLLRFTRPWRQVASAHHHDRHWLTWRAAYVGLAAHEALAGLGLAPLIGSSEAEWGLLGAMFAHKWTEAFSLATLMSLARVSRPRAAVLLTLFVAVSPVAMLVGRFALIEAGGLASWAAGISAGTFLFVGLVDLLPEAFHESDNRTRSLLLVLVGGAIGALLPGGDLGGLSAVPALSLDVFLELAPYLLFGFLIAGVLSEWLDPRWLRRWLAGESLRSVGAAAVVGAPLPLCSCSVVPVAASLRQAGAGRGATSAFLIATPETGVDSLAVTYGLLGPVMAVARPVAAVFSALSVGALVSRFGGAAAPSAAAPSAAAARPAPFPGLAPPPEPGAAASCCHAEPPPAPDEHGHLHGHGATSAPGTAVDGNRSFPARLGRALRYGAVDLVDDLALPLVLGVLASGVLAALLPTEWFDSPWLQGPLGYLAMLAIGLPIYVCAAASTPLAAVMVAKGLSPGAALVFLLASPATNFGSLLAVRQLLGGRGLTLHLAGLAAVTLVCGLVLDLLVGAFGLRVLAQVGEHRHGAAGPLQIAAAALLALLLAGALWRALAGRSAAQPLEAEPTPS